MKFIKQNESRFMVNFMEKIREKFGDEHFYLTIMPLSHDRKPHQTATFGFDNIRHLNHYLSHYETVLEMGRVEMLSLVVRIFLFNQDENSVPLKEIYHFGFYEGKILVFNKEETKHSQFTDYKTGEYREEKDVIIKSSEALYNELFNKE